MTESVLERHPLGVFPLGPGKGWLIAASVKDPMKDLPFDQLVHDSSISMACLLYENTSNI